MTEITTTDIVLAAYLKTMWCTLADIEVTGNKGEFYFTNVDDKILSDYNRGQARVEPVTFNNAIRQLTSAVNRIKRHGR